MANTNTLRHSGAQEPQRCRFLTVPEVAQLLRYRDLGSVRTLVRKGRLRALTLGKTLLIPADAVEEMIANAAGRSLAAA